MSDSAARKSRLLLYQCAGWVLTPCPICFNTAAKPLRSFAGGDPVEFALPLDSGFPESFSYFAIPLDSIPIFIYLDFVISLHSLSLFANTCP